MEISREGTDKRETTGPIKAGDTVVEHVQKRKQIIPQGKSQVVDKGSQGYVIVDQFPC